MRAYHGGLGWTDLIRPFDLAWQDTVAAKQVLMAWFACLGLTASTRPGEVSGARCDLAHIV